MGEGNNDADAAMGEEKKKRTEGDDEAGGDNGAEKPHCGKKKNKKDGAGGGEQKAPSPVVLRVDLHCQGCARKVNKAIKAAQGVEGVATDMAASTVTVSGKPDPWDLKDRIEFRTRKAVAFLSPPNPPKKKQAATADANNKPPAKPDVGKSTDDKHKNKLPPESTVVVKIRLHCNGCIDRIKRTAHKIKGVKQVTVDMEKEHVTVKGTMDAKALPDVLRNKLKRDVVAVVPPKKPDGGDGDKKKQKQQQQKQGQGADEEIKAEQQEQGSGGGGKKKNKKTQQQQQQGVDGDGDGEAAAGSMTSTEQQPFPVAMLYGGGSSSSSSYRVEMLHAPQLFSDENPNACAVM